MNSDTDYFGGAVLADSTCGHASFTTHTGEVLSFKVDHDPEFVMSGVYEPCTLSEKW